MIGEKVIHSKLLGRPQCPGCKKYVSADELFSSDKGICNKCTEDSIIPIILERPLQGKISFPEKEELILLLQETKLAIEFGITSIFTAAAGFVNDPPDTDHQKGYLEAIKVTAEETMQPLADVLPKLNAYILNIESIS